ncbi:MAG: hypothetical protein SGILL_005746 [Bacillariaceae sp.]
MAVIVLVAAWCVAVSFCRRLATSSVKKFAQVAIPDPVTVGQATCPVPVKNHTLVIYNRLGKCGSSSTKNVLSVLSNQNQFQLDMSTRYSLQLADRLNDPKLVHALEASAAGRNALYINHVHYFGDVYDISPTSPRPAYIQIVRQPIARVISQYHFLTNPRQGKYYRQNIARLKREAGFETTPAVVSSINACVAKALHPEKCERTNEMTKYFCGHARECSDPGSKEALTTAVVNLREYTFVGLLEEFQTTFAMLEKMLPAFFEGASAIAIPHSNSGVRSETTTNVTVETIEKLREWNANDIALYDLIVERFQREVKACLGSNSSESQ